MLPIHIDIGNFVNSLFMTKEEVDNLSKFVLDRLADRYMYHWERVIDTNLHQTRNTYKRATDYFYLDDYTVSFVLSGKGEGRLAMMLEEGASPFDIKDGMRRSPKAHNSGQDNWWITVPFRHATSEAIAESSIFSTRMPAQIQGVAKSIAQGEQVGSNDLPPEFRIRGVRQEINRDQKVIPQYQHKAPIYQGLVHSTKPNHGGYYTFRRISSNSEGNSWIHKGFESYDLMGKAMNNFSTEIPSVVDQAKDEFFEQTKR